MMPTSQQKSLILENVAEQSVLNKAKLSFPNGTFSVCRLLIKSPSQYQEMGSFAVHIRNQTAQTVYDFMDIVNNTLIDITEVLSMPSNMHVYCFNQCMPVATTLRGF